MFEHKLLLGHGSHKAVHAAVQRLKQDNKLEFGAYMQADTYFRDRYWSGTALTQHFDGLRLPNKKQQNGVKEYVSGNRRSEVDKLSGMLLIIFRFRNNLFHGEKWADNLQGQCENFETANFVITTLMDHADSR